MTLLALLGLLAAIEPGLPPDPARPGKPPELELRAPDKIGETPDGTPPILYTAEETEQKSVWRSYRVFIIAGVVLIVIAFYLTTRPRKRTSEGEEPPHE